MTCKDCLHYEVCKHHDAVVDFPVDDGVCRFFEDRTKWVEQKQGRWIDQSFAMNGGMVRFCTCSECHHEMTFETNYCPICGAKMAGRE